MVSPSHGKHIRIEEVYFVDPGPERIMNPVAIRPEIKDDRIWWYDTARGRSLKVTKVSMDADASSGSIPQKIVIKTQDGYDVVLKKLDLKTYNENVKKRVMGRPEFTTDEEVHDFYLNTNFEE